MRRGLRLAAVCGLAGAALAGAAGAQGTPGASPTDLPLSLGNDLARGVPVGPGVLTIDPERLFEESAMGRALAADLAAALRDLGAENRTIEAQLTAEERELTERRATLPPEQFRALAEAFDARVVAIRRAQEAKSRALQRRREEDRQRFLEAALPVLAAILSERGAGVVLDRRAVFLSFDEIDITDEAIARLDAAMPSLPAAGDGGAPPPGGD